MTQSPPERADQMPCWYAAADHRPWANTQCPAACGGGISHAERQADGSQHFYCKDHAYWRSSDVRTGRVRPLRADELV
jgi:hypothetical protein